MSNFRSDHFGIGPLEEEEDEEMEEEVDASVQTDDEPSPRAPILSPVPAWVLPAPTPQQAPFYLVWLPDAQVGSSPFAPMRWTPVVLSTFPETGPMPLYQPPMTIPPNTTSAPIPIWAPTGQQVFHTSAPWWVTTSAPAAVASPPRQLWPPVAQAGPSTSAAWWTPSAPAAVPPPRQLWPPAAQAGPSTAASWWAPSAPPAVPSPRQLWPPAAQASSAPWWATMSASSSATPEPSPRPLWQPNAQAGPSSAPWWASPARTASSSPLSSPHWAPYAQPGSSTGSPARSTMSAPLQPTAMSPSIADLLPTRGQAGPSSRPPRRATMSAPPQLATGYRPYLPPTWGPSERAGPPMPPRRGPLFAPREAIAVPPPVAPRGPPGPAIDLTWLPTGTPTWQPPSVLSAIAAELLAPVPRREPACALDEMPPNPPPTVPAWMPECSQQGAPSRTPVPAFRWIPPCGPARAPAEGPGGDMHQRPRHPLNDEEQRHWVYLLSHTVQHFRGCLTTYRNCTYPQPHRHVYRGFVLTIESIYRGARSEEDVELNSPSPRRSPMPPSPRMDNPGPSTSQRNDMRGRQ